MPLTLKGLLHTGLCLALGLTATSAYAELPANDSHWTQQKFADNVRIFTQEVKGSSFDAFKAEMVMDTSIDNIMSVFANPMSCLEWMHGCTYAEGLPGGTFTHRYGYSVNDLPWPVKDRDAALELVTTNEPASGEIRILMTAKPGIKEENTDYIRVQHSETLYILQPVTANSTKVTWIQHTEPNGVLPGWLVNALLIDIPLNSLRNLNKLAQTPKYQTKTIQYDVDGRITGVTNK